MPAAKTKAKALIDKAAAEVKNMDKALKASRATTDELLLKDPNQLARSDRKTLIQHMRDERALFEIKERRKADKKQAKQDEEIK